MISRTLKPLLTRRTIKMLTDRAKDTRYEFTEAAPYPFEKNYGIYIHVPFCFSLCSFCPYYRCIVDQDQIRNYLGAIILEIDKSTINGNPKWCYIGGGTPNTLTIPDLNRIITALKKKVPLNSIGIELTPATLSVKYLEDLKMTGITKISLGVETFSKGVLDSENRTPSREEDIHLIIETCRRLGIWISIDLMLGFNNQKIFTFRQDIETVIRLKPDQVTIYPLMTIRGTRINHQTIDDRVIFSLIEEAGSSLKPHGYSRKTLWSFCQQNGLYDSSYDELGSDYTGFGPSAISSTPGWVSVNLTLVEYIYNQTRDDKKKVFLNRHLKTVNQESWRQFGMMLYTGILKTRPYFPFYMNLFIRILKLCGYSLFSRLTRKGIFYAHDLIKTIVETKSFPIQYPGCISNRNEWKEYSAQTQKDIP